MSNRRKTQVSKRARMERALSQSFRKRCSQCGWRLLRWMDTDEALPVLGEAAVWAARTQLGPDAFGVDFWLCSRCGEYGALGLSETQ